MLKKIIGLKRDMTEKEFVISVMGAFVGTLIASFFSNMILQAEAMPLILASTGVYRRLGGAYLFPALQPCIPTMESGGWPFGLRICRRLLLFAGTQ